MLYYCDVRDLGTQALKVGNLFELIYDVAVEVVAPNYNADLFRTAVQARAFVKESSFCTVMFYLA